jgi:prepilin-type N-terminal cleavage/methylation domain-containing protein
MKQLTRRKGFTLIELMVTIAAASVLMLIVALILIMAFRSWRMNNAYVYLRRNSAFAFSMMTRDVREASYGDLKNVAGDLEITSAVDGSVATYSYNAGTLELNTSPIIPKNVDSFDFFPQDDGILLSLVLADDEFGIAITNQVFVNTRN